MSQITLWVVLILTSVGVLILDLVTGPYIMFPVAFAIPVGIGSWYLSRTAGVALAAVLVSGRLLIVLFLQELIPTWAAVVNALIQLLVLGTGSLLVAVLAEQRRRIKILEGILHICSFCKKIRSKGRWEPVEQYVTEHTDAQFSHGFCEACARTHYPEIFGQGAGSPSRPGAAPDTGSR